MSPAELAPLRFALYPVLLFAVGTVIAVMLSRRRSEIALLVLLFGGSFLLRLAGIVFNEAGGFMDARLAEPLSIELYRAWTTRGFDLHQVTFVVQALFNFPGFLVFGPERPVLLTTNAFFGALSGVIAYTYLTRRWPPAVGAWGVALLSFFPSIVNWSIFGLRDIILYFFMLLNVLSVTMLWLEPRLRLPDLIAWAISFIGIGFLRPEFAPIAALLPAALLHSGLLARIRGGGPGLSGLYWYAIGATLVAGGLVTYRVWLYNIGITDWVSPAFIAQVYAEQRFDRAVGLAFGAGTHVLPPALYVSTPWYLRVPLQAVGILVVPMPWLLTSASRLLAFADSVLLVVCLVAVLRALRRRRFEPRMHRLSVWMITVFVLTVTALGFVISNGGNAFRMRIALFPYVLVPLAVSLGTRATAPAPVAPGMAVARA